VSFASEAPQLVDASGSLQSGAWLLVALPVLSAAVLLLGGRRTDKWGHLLGATVPVVLFVYGLLLFFDVRGEATGDRSRTLHLWSWISVGSLHVDMGLLIDPLSLTFVLLITGVGALIHIYAIGYMEHDPGRRRFFAYLNLFVAAMLLLVLGNNFVVLYFGWEGVGLASYLLIAWYSDRPAAATAAKKAFIMNRVGDAGLVLAIFIMFATFGDVSFAGVFGSVGNASIGIVTALALLLLLGACGKSGQVPLQAWLPDAMEGPTPVSALIHAATMVTAGVYLIARAHPIFDATEAGRTVVTIVGAVTLLFGCIVGCAYDDIKKVLAYSTVSQIGYMFLAVGLGPGVYAIGILHLLAHGFFKAGLFLGAGSVMHAMKDQVDMRRFGGLWRVMPVTFWTMVAGYLAIIGMIPFSGFFTKDKIIEAAFDKGGTSGWILGICALLGAAITAFYMTRLMVMTFLGKRRWTDDVRPHESPPIMTVPMIILAIGSVAGGGLLVLGGALQNWLVPSVGASEEVGVHTIQPTVLTVLTLLVVIGGAAGGWFAFGSRPVPAIRPVNVTPVTLAARRDLYGNAFNEAVLMRPGMWLDRFLVWLDNRGVDGAVNGVAAAFGGGSGRLRRVQSGFVRSYALSMLGGSVLVVASLLAVRFV
jgi:NADH-quinone oxidoreductase subunit L